MNKLLEIEFSLFLSLDLENCAAMASFLWTLFSALQTRSLQYALFGVPLEDLPEASDNA